MSTGTELETMIDTLSRDIAEAGDGLCTERQFDKAFARGRVEDFAWKNRSAILAAFIELRASRKVVEAAKSVRASQDDNTSERAHAITVDLNAMIDLDDALAAVDACTKIVDAEWKDVTPHAAGATR